MHVARLPHLHSSTLRFGGAGSKQAKHTYIFIYIYNSLSHYRNKDTAQAFLSTDCRYLSWSCTLYLFLINSNNNYLSNLLRSSVVLPPHEHRYTLASLILIIQLAFFKAYNQVFNRFTTYSRSITSLNIFGPPTLDSLYIINFGSAPDANFRHLNLR